MNPSDTNILFTFCVSYKTTDGKRYEAFVLARHWDDAIAQADFLGVQISGVLIARYDENGELVPTNGEQCPPCPPKLRGCPSIEKPMNWNDVYDDN